MFTLSSSAVRGRFVAFCLSAALLPMAASASTLMLDFGPTVATGTSLTNSPYHDRNPSFTDSYWNTIGLADVSTGLRYSDASVATGVTLTLGASLDSATLNFSEKPRNSSALGGSLSSGIYTGTSVGKDGIFTTTTPGANNLVGIKVGGLAAGDYEVYFVGINTSLASTHQSPMDFYLAATSDVGTFATAGLTPDATTLYTAAGNVEWTEGASYGKFSISLAAGEYLVLVADGTGIESRGFLNAVQIVQVPEPGVMALSLMLGLCALPLIRRKRFGSSAQ